MALDFSAAIKKHCEAKKEKKIEKNKQIMELLDSNKEDIINGLLSNKELIKADIVNVLNDVLGSQVKPVTLTKKLEDMKLKNDSKKREKKKGDYNFIYDAVMENKNKVYSNVKKDDDKETLTYTSTPKISANHIKAFLIRNNVDSVHNDKFDCVYNGGITKAVQKKKK